MRERRCAYACVFALTPFSFPPPPPLPEPPPSSIGLSFPWTCAAAGGRGGARGLVRPVPRRRGATGREEGRAG